MAQDTQKTTGGDGTTTVSEDEFNELVDAKAADKLDDKTQEVAKTACEAVSYMIDPEDDAASESAKAMAKAMPGDIQGSIEASIDKALDKKRQMKQGGASQEKAALMGGLGGDRETGYDADAFKGHWLHGDYSDAANIGKGELSSDMAFHVMRSFQKRNVVDWNFIREDAERLGNKAVANVVEKNLQDTDFSEGGALIPDEFAEDIIGFLHGQTALRAINPNTVELTSELIQSRISGTVTVTYRGEGGTVNSSTHTTDEVRFSENEMVTRVIESRRFIRNAPPNALSMLRDDMRSAMRTTEESTLLRSSGTQNEPTGILNLVNSSNKFNDSSSDPVTPTEASEQLVKQQKLVHSDGKVPRDRPSYILPDAVRLALSVLTDSDGNLSSIAMMVRDNDLFGVPFEVTNQIPTDLSGSNDETEVYYIEASEYIIAEATDVEVRELQEATVTDGSGNDRKLADRGEMAIEFTQSHDANLRHDVGASVMEQVDWHDDILG